MGQLLKLTVWLNQFQFALSSFLIQAISFAAQSNSCYHNLNGTCSNEKFVALNVSKLIALMQNNRLVLSGIEKCTRNSGVAHLEISFSFQSYTSFQQVGVQKLRRDQTFIVWWQPRALNNDFGHKFPKKLSTIKVKSEQRTSIFSGRKCLAETLSQRQLLKKLQSNGRLWIIALTK